MLKVADQFDADEIDMNLDDNIPKLHMVFGSTTLVIYVKKDRILYDWYFKPEEHWAISGEIHDKDNMVS